MIQIQKLNIKLKKTTAYIKTNPNILDLDFTKILNINNEIHDFKISFEKRFSLLGEFLIPALKDIELELANIYLIPALSQEEKKIRMLSWILKQEEWLQTLQSTLKIFFDNVVLKENK
ncbi:hypothetical protein I9T54_00655 [Campylobacter peloridis]|nr:hypothetical protein [Campylobacter peloridis]